MFEWLDVGRKDASTSRFSSKVITNKLGIPMHMIGVHTYMHRFVAIGAYIHMDICTYMDTN